MAGLDVNATDSGGNNQRACFLAMQQNLLATRLGLVVHREKKEMAVYELIAAKGGIKLKEAAPAGESDDEPSFGGGIKRDDEGFPILPPGHTMYAIAMDHARLQGVSETMEHFAATLSGQLSAPVTDATGLTGKYDFTVKWLPGNLRPDDDPRFESWRVCCRNSWVCR